MSSVEPGPQTASSVVRSITLVTFWTQSPRGVDGRGRVRHPNHDERGDTAEDRDQEHTDDDGEDLLGARGELELSVPGVAGRGVA